MNDIAKAMAEANAAVKTIEISRKDKKTGEVITKHYVMVNERVIAFRKVFPEGTISTEIIEDNGERVTVKAWVYDDDRLLATGHAYELKQSSYINQTSYIENAETSAVGRALGFLGFGVDDSLGSAEELANAITGQEEIKAEEKRGLKLNAREVKAFRAWINENGIDEAKLCAGCKVAKLEDLTLGKYRNILDNADRAKEEWGK